MRRNNFSSAADRRWQRRYERIQQRKEEEQYRQELKEQNEFDQLVNGVQSQQIRYVREELNRFDISEPIVASAPTFTITIPEPEFDRPNRNGIVINRDVWDDALAKYFGITSTPGEESARLRAVSHDYAELSRQITKAWEDYIQSHAAEWFDSFVDVKDIGLGDRATFSVDMSLAADIQEAELDTGDTDILDSFLGEFFLQGV